MKKLEKKSGRRACRKRERMERLLEEVAPEREGSGLLDAIHTEESGHTDGSKELATAPPLSTDLGKAVPASKPLISSTGSQKSVTIESPSTKSSDSRFSESGRLLQVQTNDSHVSARRRRRMQRIKKELQQQVVAAAPVQQPKLDSAPDIAKSTADAVRQIAEAPKDDNDPTAQSMVAIAGAVTALASAIQFQMTDRPEHGRPTMEPQSNSTPTRVLPSEISAVGTDEGSDSVATANTESMAEESSVPSPDVIQQTTQAVPHERVSKKTKTKKSKAKKTKAKAAAAIVASMPEPEPENEVDSDSTFEESFFDNDESDVAGAYTVLPPAQQPVESYRHWFHRVVVRNKWMTWFTAFYVHWLILLIMMMVFVHGPDQAANLLLNGAFADTPEIETESFDMSIAEPVAKPESKDEAAASEPNAEQLTLSEMAEETVAISDSILRQLSEQDSEESGDVSSEDTAADHSVQAPSTPTGSISQGSFSVWTEPEYPNPGEPYRIIVQIQLPPKTKNYHLRDLNGVVVGSDGYRKTIPGINPGPLPIVDGCVRLVIPIVSADERVKDTIFIRSKLLKETQKLLIEF